ncbi:MAG: hypothetical protein ABIT61_13535 [Steroidobacteraceae bacterium]
MLKLILVITLGVPNVDAMTQAYNQWLGYTTVEQGLVGTDLASAWDAPRMAGRPYVLVQPESKANVYLRFVQVDAVRGYVPMTTFGWNAIELMAQDPDALHQRFKAADSPFAIAGVPRPLGPNSTTVAMQVIGPAKETVYLTRVGAQQGASQQGAAPPAVTSAPVRQGAITPVDRPFVMIVGGPDVDVIGNFYADMFGLTKGRTTMARMTVLNKANGLDIETTHPMSGVRVPGPVSIEIDGYPATAKARPTRKGELPPAIAMVGFEIDSLDNLKVPLLAPPRAVAGKPYSGRRVAVARGAAGELIELIESP